VKNWNNFLRDWIVKCSNRLSYEENIDRQNYTFLPFFKNWRLLTKTPQQPFSMLSSHFRILIIKYSANTCHTYTLSHLQINSISYNTKNEQKLQIESLRIAWKSCAFNRWTNVQGFYKSPCSPGLFPSTSDTYTGKQIGCNSLFKN